MSEYVSIYDKWVSLWSKCPKYTVLLSQPHFISRTFWVPDDYTGNNSRMMTYIYYKGFLECCFSKDGGCLRVAEGQFKDSTASHTYPGTLIQVWLRLCSYHWREKGCANYSASVLSRTLSVLVPLSGLTAAAAVSELAWGCRWKCWCVLLFWVVRCPGGGQGICGGDRARLVGVGLCPEGVLAESFIQNAMWPVLPHGAVGILRGCGIADSTERAMGTDMSAKDWTCLQCQMTGGISGMGSWRPVIHQVLHIDPH